MMQCPRAAFAFTFPEFISCHIEGNEKGSSRRIKTEKSKIDTLLIYIYLILYYSGSLKSPLH